MQPHIIIRFNHVIKFWAVTNLPSLQESRPEILGRKEEGVYKNL